MKQNVRTKNKKISIYTLLLLLIILVGCKTHSVKNEIVQNNNRSSIEDIKQQKQYKISDYENNEDYFIREIDINKDGVLDKVVCSNKYMGNELLLFQKNKEHYYFVVKTINFSEDGGRIIDDVFPENKSDNVLKIKTFFPDGGLDLATYFIAFKNGEWKLQKTIYETRYWQKDVSKRYVCEVKQNILIQELTTEAGIQKLKQIPKEEKRGKNCKIYLEKH